jgi:hypothetical protein
MTLYALVFAGAFILDFVWARYNLAISQQRVIASGVFAMLIYVGNNSIVIGIVNDPWLLVPSAAGAFLGTILSVWMHKRGL